MSPYLKSAAVVAILVVIWTVAQVFRGIAMTGSGGLGAMSFGISESLVEFLAVTIVVWAVVYWRRRRRRSATRR